MNPKIRKTHEKRRHYWLNRTRYWSTKYMLLRREYIKQAQDKDAAYKTIKEVTMKAREMG